MTDLYELACRRINLWLSCQPYLSKADTLLIISLLLTPHVSLISASGLEVASSSFYP